MKVSITEISILWEVLVYDKFNEILWTSAIPSLYNTCI